MQAAACGSGCGPSGAVVLEGCKAKVYQPVARIRDPGTPMAAFRLVCGLYWGIAQHFLWGKVLAGCDIQLLWWELLMSVAPSTAAQDATFSSHLAKSSL